MHGFGLGMGFGWIGMIIMLLFWVGLIVAAALVIKWLFASNGRMGSHKKETDLSAQDILDRRYARGEITRDQYHTMSKDLRQE
jgi:putative membrane protein